MGTYRAGAGITQAEEVHMRFKDPPYWEARAARERDQAKTAANWKIPRHIATAQMFEQRAARLRNPPPPKQPRRLHPAERRALILGT